MADMKPQKTFLAEADLVLALKNHDIIGMQALTDMYSDSLGGVISRIINDTELSKDILQEVFIKIWMTANSYQTCRGRLFTWMINVAKNYSIDTLRSKRYRNSRRNINIDDCQQSVEIGNRITYNPDTVLIRELVDELKPEYNILLEMVYFKGYTHVEVAEELNIPLGTVKTRIRTAILELRDQFD